VICFLFQEHEVYFFHPRFDGKPRPMILFCHRIGAGALPAIAWHYRKKLGWGNSGAFLFLMSPSYVHCIRQEQVDMGQWPDGTKVLPLISTDIPTAHSSGPTRSLQPVFPAC
jgi:hypothetical protein